MFDFYYSIWKIARKAEHGPSSYCEAWDGLPRFIKALFMIFIIIGIIAVSLLTLGSLGFIHYTAAAIFGLVYVGLAFILERLADNLPLTPTYYIYEKKKIFTQKVGREFFESGIKNAEQVLQLKEETNRIIQQRKHSREIVISRVIQIVIVGFLFWSLNAIVSNVGRYFEDDTALLYAQVVLVLSGIVVLLFYGIQVFKNIFSTKPVTLLQEYSDFLLDIYLEHQRKGFDSLKETAEAGSSIDRAEQHHSRCNVNHARKNVHLKHCRRRCRKQHG